MNYIASLLIKSISCDETFKIYIMDFIKIEKIALQNYSHVLHMWRLNHLIEKALTDQVNRFYELKPHLSYSGSFQGFVRENVLGEH